MEVASGTNFAISAATPVKPEGGVASLVACGGAVACGVAVAFGGEIAPAGAWRDGRRGAVLKAQDRQLGERFRRSGQVQRQVQLGRAARGGTGGDIDLSQRITGPLALCIRLVLSRQHRDAERSPARSDKAAERVRIGMHKQDGADRQDFGGVQRAFDERDARHELDLLLTVAVDLDVFGVDDAVVEERDQAGGTVHQARTSRHSLGVRLAGMFLAFSRAARLDHTDVDAAAGQILAAGADGHFERSLPRKRDSTMASAVGMRTVPQYKAWPGAETSKE